MSSRNIIHETRSNEVANLNVPPSASYWLSRIRESESVEKHQQSLGFFKLAREAGCEDIKLLRRELESYASRHNLFELGESAKEVFRMYGIPLKVFETCSQKYRLREKVDKVFDCAIPYIHNVTDRNSLSLVCRKWYELDGLTRKHVTVHVSYGITPSRLFQRFTFLESLTLKGMPVSFQNKLNSYITPWVQQIAVSFICLKEVRLRSMVVSDSDLELLARSRGIELRFLKITKCSGFSTDGLLHISKYCNNLRSLNLKGNTITEKDGKWLHELGLRSTCIESLNFYHTLLRFNVEDLVLLAKSCSHSLVSLKIPEGGDLVDFRDFFSFAVRLEHFGHAKFVGEEDKYAGFTFPPNLRCIAFDHMIETAFLVVLPFAHQLTELDLRLACLTEDGHCFVVEWCPNLEVLYTMTFGDKLMQVLGQFCKKLRKLKTKSRMFKKGSVSHRGLIALSQGCLELECLHIDVMTIKNKALECIGDHLKNLLDFKIILHDEGTMRDRPLDNGVQALLIGCTKLERLDIRLQRGGLTDRGLGDIGKYGRNLIYIFLGSTGDSDAGLVMLSDGCPKLRKLKMKCCPFSRLAAAYVFKKTSLRYMLVQDSCDRVILKMSRPYLEQALF